MTDLQTKSSTLIFERLETECRAYCRDIPAVFSTAKGFETPSWSEGFDELYEVSVDAENNFVVRAMPKETV